MNREIDWRNNDPSEFTGVPFVAFAGPLVPPEFDLSQQVKTLFQFFLIVPENSRRTNMLSHNEILDNGGKWGKEGSCVESLKDS